MRILYILEYKSIDVKGRQKNAKHVGVFKTLEELEAKKSSLLEEIGDSISFQVYCSESPF